MSAKDGREQSERMLYIIYTALAFKVVEEATVTHSQDNGKKEG